MDSRRLNPETPQFPPGTMLALVRRMMVVDDSLQPAVTPITQKVQIRLYRQVLTHPYGGEFEAMQSVYEWVMRRADLLAPRPEGLFGVHGGEREFQRTSGRESATRDELAGPEVLTTCARCHSGSGIFSVESYTSFLVRSIRDAPQLAPAEDTNYQFIATSDWKKQQFDWGLLRGLLEQVDSRSH